MASENVETQTTATVAEDKESSQQEVPAASMDVDENKPEEANQQLSSSESEEEEDDWRASVWSRFGFKKQPLPDPKKMWADEENLTLDERRDRYHCRRFIEAKNIPSWAEYAKELFPDGKVPEIEKAKYKPDNDINGKIALYHGDITEIECDAIVNAANESCLGGGGIDGAIHRAAGDQLYQECRTLNGCPTGQTKITRGYDLPAKYVLHTVGPVGQGSSLLKSCYVTCLKLVGDHNLKTVVFCGVSTGIFGFPLYPASEIALKVMREWLEVPGNKDKVDKIIVCTFLGKEKVCYEKLMPYYFPPVFDNNNNNNNNDEVKQETKEEEKKEEKGQEEQKEEVKE